MHEPSSIDVHQTFGTPIVDNGEVTVRDHHDVLGHVVKRIPSLKYQSMKPSMLAS